MKLFLFCCKISINYNFTHLLTFVFLFKELNLILRNLIDFQVEPALASPSQFSQRAALQALAVSADGCQDHIREKYLASFLQALGDTNFTLYQRFIIGL